MKGQGLWLALMMCLVVMITSKSYRPPPLPSFSSVHVSTSEVSEGAQITVEYVAPEKPFALWFVNGLPLSKNRIDYMVVNDFHGRGITILSSLRDKRSDFSLCLQNVVGETCMHLNPLPLNDVTQQVLRFPWPLLSPGPLVRYESDRNVKIHVPELNTPYNYTYSAMLLSKNPNDPHGRLVMDSTRGMDGGHPGDPVTISKAERGRKGWVMELPTAITPYEGVLLVNTTFVPHEGIVKSCTLYRPFTIYDKDHSAPFAQGFVTPVPPSFEALSSASRPGSSAAGKFSWRCRMRMDCMVVCPFLSNAPEVRVTVSRMNRGMVAVLNNDQLPLDMQRLEGGRDGGGGGGVGGGIGGGMGGLVGGEGEEEQAETRMLGPYFGYGYIFIPDFFPWRDAGTYKCKYSTAGSPVGVIALVEVE